MKLSREEVLHIARLARLGLTDAEVDRLGRQQVDTTGVPPTAQPNTLQNVLKADKARPSLPQDEVLANAPCRDGDFFRVRAVLE
jgi:aspartyl-tRNA(Asn)/glutamyl-tRNA(Gln) amidotransferase subunit C